MVTDLLTLRSIRAPCDKNFKLKIISCFIWIELYQINVFAFLKVFVFI